MCPKLTPQVTRETAPASADRLYNLVKMGYYNDMRFYRNNKKVIQFGVHALKEMNREFYAYVMFVRDQRYSVVHTRDFFFGILKSLLIGVMSIVTRTILYHS